MDANIMICTAILQSLSGDFGKDYPVNRLTKCIKIAGSVENCHKAIACLNQMSLISVVTTTCFKTGESVSYPVLKENVHKLVERHGAINILSTR
ncbi:hypothetical protein [Cedecea sp.]|jgi:hypothetical protein|uniref:hypothetical protein n=1 Tax=Cedecea sp. TaxID=1970739 RepID=UPI002F3FA9BD